MVTLVDQFPCTIPHGTAQATPTTIAIPMQSRIVTGIRIRVPRGPNGQMGFQIGAQGQQIIPENAGKFIVADDEIFEWDLTDFPQGGSYQLIGYNTGFYDHTVYVTLLSDPVSAQTPVSTPLPSGSSLSGPTPLPSEAPVVPSDGTETAGGTVGGVAASVTPPTIPAPPPLNLPTIPSPTTGGAPAITQPVLPTPPTF